MKPLFSLATVLSLSLPISAFAAPPAAQSGNASQSKAAPIVQVEPAALALLDRAITAHEAPNGIRLKFESKTLGQERVTTGVLEWKAPSSLRIEKNEGQNSSQILFDGTSVFLVNNGKTFRRMPFAADKMPEGAATALVGMVGSGIGQFLPALLSGKNMLRISPKEVEGLANYRLYARTLPQIQIDGEDYKGLRQTTIFSMGERSYRLEATGWFDAASHLLRRTQMIVSIGAQRVVTTDKILETDLNPTFAPNTFVWSPPPGIKEETGEDSAGSSVYWDPKLVPGAKPYALTGKDLTGKAISLSKYKGKVVLLDFWATWCGPCVEEIPNVVRNYRKYHARGFEIIGISLDNDKKSLTTFIKAHKMPWPQIFDKPQGQSKALNATRYKVQGIPFMLLIGKDGKIAAVNPRGPELETAIKKALAR